MSAAGDLTRNIPAIENVGNLERARNTVAPRWHVVAIHGRMGMTNTSRFTTEEIKQKYDERAREYALCPTSCGPRARL